MCQILHGVLKFMVSQKGKKRQFLCSWCLLFSRGDRNHLKIDVKKYKTKPHGVMRGLNENCLGKVREED